MFSEGPESDLPGYGNPLLLFRFRSSRKRSSTIGMAFAGLAVVYLELTSMAGSASQPDAPVDPEWRFRRGTSLLLSKRHVDAEDGGSAHAFQQGPAGHGSGM
jgi:hypothetical protein